MDVLELGTVPYAEALDLQRRLATERAEGKRRDTLILLEHPHVITRGPGYNGHTLGKTAHPVFDVERGGDVTYHGPGQLVGYPIVHLKERGLLVGRYLRGIELSLTDALDGFGVRAHTIRGFTGVWTGERKIASIGVAVRSWVAYHGFALNVTTNLSQFKGIYPCGLEPERMTSMERVLGRDPGMARVRREVRLSLERLLETSAAAAA